MIYTPTVGMRYEYFDYTSRRTYPYDTKGTRSTDKYDIGLEETRYGLSWDNDHPSNEKIIAELDGKKVHGIPEWTYRVGIDLYPMNGAFGSA